MRKASGPSPDSILSILAWPAWRCGIPAARTRLAMRSGPAFCAGVGREPAPGPAAVSGPGTAAQLADPPGPAGGPPRTAGGAGWVILQAPWSSPGLAAVHGDRPLLSDLDLVIAPVGVIGPVGVNSAGKPALLQRLAGARAPDADTMTISPPKILPDPVFGRHLVRCRY